VSGTLRAEMRRVRAFRDHPFRLGIDAGLVEQSVESFTPVHSAHEARPMQCLHVGLYRSGEKSGALLPPHSMKVKRDTMG